MNGNKATVWKLTLAIFALIAGMFVYLVFRSHPPALFEPFRITAGFSFTDAAIVGSAPALLHTFAFCLIVGACASSQAGALRHGLLWIAIAVAFEISQLYTFASRISGWLDTVLSDALSGLVATYWSKGVFDPLDIAATLAGGALAMVLLVILPGGRSDRIDR